MLTFILDFRLAPKSQVWMASHTCKKLFVFISSRVLFQTMFCGDGHLGFHKDERQRLMIIFRFFLFIAYTNVEIRWPMQVLENFWFPCLWQRMSSILGKGRHSKLFSFKYRYVALLRITKLSGKKSNYVLWWWSSWISYSQVWIASQLFP
jgi:hypothetical protein